MFIGDRVDIAPGPETFRCQRPKQPVLDIGCNHPVWEKANAKTENREALGFFEIWCRRRDAFSQPVSNAVVGQAVRFIGAGENKRLLRQFSDVFECLPEQMMPL